jgi:hypothetical protein
MDSRPRGWAIDLKETPESAMMKVRKCVFGDVDAKSLEYVFLDWHPDLLGGAVGRWT